MHGYAAHYELHISCRGEPDPVLQYVVDIKDIDAAARATLLPALCAAAWSDQPIPPAMVLREQWAPLNRLLDGRLHSARLFLTPTYSLEMTVNNPNSVLLRQRFDFAAAHRLQTPMLSEAENRARYGKCNNPRGHGHNYQFEPAVRVALDDSGLGAIDLPGLEELARLAIIDRFDHTHLNEDTAEFCVEKGGLIPTVENISKVLFGLMGTALNASHPGASLVSMTVWETDRTSATYPA